MIDLDSVQTKLGIDIHKFLELYKEGVPLIDISKELNEPFSKIKIAQYSLHLRGPKKFREVDYKELMNPPTATLSSYEQHEEFHRRKRAQKFLKKALKVHGNKYTYNLETYGFSLIPVSIYCKIHGEFKQLPAGHLSGDGCPKCGLESRVQKRRSTTEDFIQKAQSIHGSTYTYDKTDYLNNHTKVLITCAIHGEFEQVPDSHLAGHGCKQCGYELKEQTIFIPYYDKPTTLYYIKVIPKDVKLPTVYKIGITTRSVLERFKGEHSVVIKILKEKMYATGEPAWKAEQAILQKYREFKYRGPPILKGGNTELFIKDIFEEINI